MGSDQDKQRALDSLDALGGDGEQHAGEPRRRRQILAHPEDRAQQVPVDSRVPLEQRPHYRPAGQSEGRVPLEQRSHYVPASPETVGSHYDREGYAGRRSDAGPERFHGQPDADSVYARQDAPATYQQPDRQREQPLGLSPKDYKRARKRAEKDAARQSRAVDRRVAQESEAAGKRAEKRARKQAVKQQKKALRRTRTSTGKRVKRTLLALLVLIVVACGLYMHALDKNMHIDDPALEDALTGTALPWQPYYVLIAGSDAREDEAARADTLILARIDPRGKQVTLISIPRDTMVEIPGYGTSKINAAHAYGGPALTVQVVSQFAGVPISHYIEVGFAGFVDVVDAVGGVTVDVPPNTEVDGIVVPEGVQRLNGEQALIFVRCRKTYAAGDLQRAANQRAFMVALSSEILSAPPWKWPGLGLAISKCISTDAYSAELVLMALTMKGMDMSSMYTAVVPSYTDTIDGVSYVVADEAAWADMMARVDAGQDPNG